MSTLKDVNYSLNGEQQIPTPAKEKTLSGVVKYNDNKYPKDKEWYIFKLVDNSKSGGVYIPNIDDVWNPKTGKVERIRLLSGVHTIWQSEQKELTADYVKMNMRSIEFPRGVKIRRVAAHDATMLEFMRLSNSNIGNPKRVKTSKFEFFEYDFAAAEKDAFEREDFELEMALLAKKEGAAAMKKHAAFLGIRLINELGEPKTEEGIRREYVMYAKRNPEYFNKTRNTPQIEISWQVKKAISETLIDIGTEKGKVFWSNGGGMICAIPQGENPETYLTDLAMTNSEEGIKFKEQLKQVVT
jgi:hypothetical protein